MAMADSNAENAQMDKRQTVRLTALAFCAG